MAEKLSKEMAEKIDEITKQYEDDKKKQKEEINKLFKQYGIDPIY